MAKEGTKPFYTEAEVAALIAIHTAIAAAHHTKYTDAEALAAAIAGRLVDAAGAIAAVGAPALIASHAALFGLHSKIILKTADETVNNSSTLQDDNELFLAIGANEIWLFWLFFWGNSGTTPDFKIGWAIPSGASGVFDSIVTAVASTSLTATLIISGFAASYLYRFYGEIKNGATAGNLQFQWAQNTATVSDTKVLANSCIIAHRIV